MGLRRGLAAVGLAGALMVGMTGVSMAATPTVGAGCDEDGGLVHVSFIYDASQTPPPVTTVEVVNNDSKPFQVGVNFYSLADGHLLWSGSAAFNVGTTDLNVTPLGQHMVSFTNKFGTSWVFPVVVSCSS